MLPNVHKKQLRHNAQSVTSLPALDTSHGNIALTKDPSLNNLHIGKNARTPYDISGTLATSMSLERLNTQVPTDSQ